MQISSTHRLIASVATAAAVLASACGTPAINPATNAGSGPVSLEFWTINLKEGYQAYIESSINTYQQQHPGVTINWIDVPDFEKTNTKLLAAIAGGQHPDVVNLTPFLLPQFVQRKTLYSIDELTDDPNGLAAQYTEGFWNAGVVGGKAYAIPYYGSVSALIYNASLFEKAGLDPNNPPKTWDEVFRDARTIHDKTGVSGFAQTLDNFDDAGNAADILAEQAGVPLLSADNKKAALVTPQAESMLQSYATGVSEGWIDHASVNGEVMDSARELAQGNTAMVFLGPWITRWLKDNTDPATYANFRVADHPQGPTGAANAFLQNFVVPKASQHPKEALDFAVYMSNTTLELAKKAPLVPTVKSLAADPYFQSQPELKVLVDQQARFYWPMQPQLTPMLDALREQFQQALLGQKTPHQALFDAAQKWDSLLSS